MSYTPPQCKCGSINLIPYCEIVCAQKYKINKNGTLSKKPISSSEEGYYNQIGLELICENCRTRYVLEKNCGKVILGEKIE